MASSDLRKRLECSVCLNVYADPVNLKCGHNFCRACIDQALDSQAASGLYLCPECRDEFRERPALHKNLTLRGLVEDFLSSQPEQEKAVVFCTYCVDASVAAVKSCLLCEASLCENHLRVHSKAPEHVLSPLTASPERRKCPLHRKVLEYYCTTDAACICAFCKQEVEHRGHQVETLDKAAANKKHNLKYNVLQRLMTKREDTRKKIQSLQQRQGEAQKKAGGTAKKVTALCGGVRRQVEDLEKKALSEAHRQAQRESLSLSDLIPKLEAMMGELFRKMRHIEELCDTADPLTVLQDSETGDLCDPEEGGQEEREGDDGGDLDLTMILYALSTLSDLTASIRQGMYLAEPTPIFLDEKTASNSLEISGDMKTVSVSTTSQNRPKSSQRFQGHSQVLSSQGISSGRHYWEADVGGSRVWTVGVSYPSVERGHYQFGSSSKSWCLRRSQDNQYSVIHNNKSIELPDIIFIYRVRVYVNFEAGQVSFYQMSHPIRHLYTFTTTFTEPLHAALFNGSGCITLI